MARIISLHPEDDLIKRDKVSLDIVLLKDESLEESTNLPEPKVIAEEIVEDCNPRWISSQASWKT